MPNTVLPQEILQELVNRLLGGVSNPVTPNLSNLVGSSGQTLGNTSGVLLPQTVGQSTGTANPLFPFPPLSNYAGVPLDCHFPPLTSMIPIQDLFFNSLTATSSSLTTPVLTFSQRPPESFVGDAANVSDTMGVINISRSANGTIPESPPCQTPSGQPVASFATTPASSTHAPNTTNAPDEEDIIVLSDSPLPFDMDQYNAACEHCSRQKIYTQGPQWLAGKHLFDPSSNELPQKVFPPPSYAVELFISASDRQGNSHSKSLTLWRQIGSGGQIGQVVWENVYNELLAEHKHQLEVMKIITIN